MPVYKWSKTAADNATADSTINWAEGQAPSSVNDSARAEMAAIARWRDDISGTLTTTGSSTAYSILTNSAFASAAAMSGALLCFIPHTTSGVDPTLSVDGHTARPIRAATGVNVPSGALVAGTPYAMTYVHATTEFILVGELGVVGAVVPLDTLDIVSGTELIDPALGDVLPIYDLTATANRKIALSDLWKVINSLVEIDDPPAVDDVLALYDMSGAVVGKIALSDLFAIVNALDEDTAPDQANDFLLSYDVSASAAKKVNASVVNPFGNALLHVLDQKTSGTAGGTFSAGAWRTRTLNTTKTNEITGASLDSNQITLPAGTYYVDAIGTARQTDHHVIKLHNITDSSDILTGVKAYAQDSIGNDATFIESSAFLKGRFTLASTKILELQHRCSNSGSYGEPASFGVFEVYADVLIWKVV